MRLYTFSKGHTTFLHEHKHDYQTGDSLQILVKQVKTLAKAEAVGLFLYDQWSDQFVLTHASTEHHLFVDNLSADLIQGFDRYQQVSYLSSYHITKSKRAGQACMIALFKEEKILGFIILTIDQEQPLSEKQRMRWLEIAKDANVILTELTNMFHVIEQVNKYELMYSVTQKFHSTMNSKDVLSEIVNTIGSIYPTFDCHLFLSKNFQDEQNLPVKELIYNDEYAEKASVQAFLSGEIKLVKRPNRRKITLYAPLNGKQGIYGVMELTSYEIEQIPDDDIEFVRLLANTAGNALENAQLYQQSTQLIQDLQLINSFAHELNKLSCLSDTTAFIKSQIETSFKAEEVGFILYNQAMEFSIEQHSSDFFHHQDSRKKLTLLLNQIKQEREAIFIGDAHCKFPELALTCRSVIILPMIQSEQLLGCIIIMHPQPYFFTFDQFKLMKSLVQHSTLAFGNIILREQLEQSVITDYLTKLFSRKYLDEKCNEHLHVGQCGVFILIDLDDFKKINDTYGHDVGDHILIQVANLIRKEIEGHGFAARWGGEELAIYLAEASYQEGQQFSNRLLYLIEKTTQPSVTASIGMAYWSHEQPIDLTTLFDKADQALYDAKHAGKNQFSFR